MADFQLTTPVAFLIFNRPDTTARVFEAIRQAKPPKLLVVADGPRPDKPDDIEKCKTARAIIDRVDWDCEVLKNYSDVNLGCRKRVSSGLDWVFSTVEKAIILEDDCLPHPSFFRFCQELLDHYQNDERIMSIVGCNFQFGRQRTEYSYYFSQINLIWGWATWRRAWHYYDSDMSLWPEVKQDNLLQYILRNPQKTKYWTKVFQKTYDEDINSWGYRWILSCFLQHGLAITPNRNLVSNVGFGVNATHTTKDSSPINSVNVEAMEFPLCHTPYIIPHIDADKFTYRVYCQLSLTERIARKLKTIFKLLFQMPFSMLKKTIKNTLKSAKSAYKSAGHPLLTITKLIEKPMYWFYHQSFLLRHDSKFYWKPFLLKHFHDILVVNHPQDFKIYGEKINFRSYGSLMSVQGYYVGEIEYHLVQYIVSQIKPGFVMLDVGAHHGVYTLIVAYELKSRGWSGVIHSFEPNPLNFSLLQYNVKQNQLTDYVVLHNEAVSNTEGRQKLLVNSSENSGCQLESVEVLEQGNHPDLIQEYEIQVCKLDDLIDQVQNVNIIKMDIQGAEPLALQGGETIIKRDKPILVVEAVENWWSTDKTKEFLDEHNYEMYGVSSKGELCHIDSPDVFVSWDCVGLPLE